ncbi:hypothetical protein [Archangium lansingense]|uniref:Photosynthesis system II assembly factor Ycf48/Hcf136-like domain-containing protein n=1 Tax=Archangium lansingense TaxID=2995310 RepID=A0ABT4A6L9_9BACT|nr:hypothetical protein [Archangium lansinium]MCY1077298.1 hypothetical protein [Archangium lansinium]
MALLATCGVLAGCGGARESEWVRADSKTTQTLESIHGSGSNDVWAVGRLGTLIHWDGTQWSVVDSGMSVDLHAVWTVGPKDAWAVGERGTVLHWDGVRWSRVNVGVDNPFVDVWASGPSDVWIVPGSGGTRYLNSPMHFDGKTWSERPLPTGSGANSRLWGSGSGDVWLIGASLDGDLLHWTGASWSVVNPEVGSEPDCVDGWGSGPDELWVLCDMYALEPALLFKNASGWKQLPSFPSDDVPSNWNGLWGGGGKLWLVANGGVVWHFNGSAWIEELRWDLDAPDLEAVWGSSESDIWAVGSDGAVVRRTKPASP